MSQQAEYWRAAFDSLTAHLALLDGEGVIVAVNQAWRRFATNNGQPHPDACIGTNYLAVCERAVKDEPHAATVAAGIRAVLARQRAEFSTSYPCHSPTRKRWFMLRVTPFQGPPPARLVVAHENINAPKAAQIRATRYAQELRSANRTLIAQARDLSRAEALEADRSRILELIARNETSETVLHEIALLVERQHSDVCCGIIVRRNDSYEVTATDRMPSQKVRFLAENTADVLGS